MGGAGEQGDNDSLHSGAAESETDGAVLERPLDVCFAYADVDAAYRRAVENGAIPVSPPVAKSWWQKVWYVRDMDGIAVRLDSYKSCT